MDIVQELETFKNDIITVFHLTGQRIFAYSEIAGILAEKRQEWDVSELTVDAFLRTLVQWQFIKIQEIAFPSRSYVRYVRGDPSIYAVLLSLHRAAYFSHLTAMYFHKLTSNECTEIYLNIEQGEKTANTSRLLQENIDKAFKQRPRVTNNTTTSNGYRIYMLNGMHTGQLGVETIDFPRIPQCRTTSIERTLIDIAVRPSYSGGVGQVMDAYRRAKNRVIVKKLIEQLKTLKYVYPYHQAIGFYMERSGFDDAALKAIKENFTIEYDFYLAHEMKKPDYSQQWRLYFPEDF